MLASTMQHSTHNHTPTPPTTTTPTSRALDGPGQEQPEKTPTGVSSGPNSVPNPRNHTGSRTTMNRSLCSTQPHPNTLEHGIKEKENHNPSTDPDPKAGGGRERVAPTTRGDSLERR